MDIVVLSRVESVAPELFEELKNRTDGADKEEERLLRDRAPGLAADAAKREPVSVPLDGDSHKTAVAPASSRALYRWGFLEALLRNAGKGFAVGYGGSITLSIVEILMKAKASKGTVKMPSKGLDLLGKGHIQIGLYLGAMLASYNTAMHLTRTSKGSAAYYRGAIAGTIAGASLQLAPKKTRGYVALLVAVRALEVAARNHARKHEESVPRAVAANADVLLMCLASAPVLYCWIFAPDALEPSYLRFLNRQSGKDESVLRAVAASFRKDMARGEASQPELLEKLNAHRSRCRPALPPLDARCTHCDVLHLPNQTCSGHVGRYLWEGFLRALPLYAPVHLVPLVLFSAPKIFRTPLSTLAKSGWSIARSSAFLSAYCSLGWVGLCSWARLHKAFPWVPLSPLQARGGHALFASFYFWAVTAGVVCGLAVLLEKPSRRIELALYTTTQALRAAPRGGRVGERALGHAAVPAFAAGLGILMHHYVRHPETIRPSYLVLMRRFFDAPGGRHKSLLSFLNI